MCTRGTIIAEVYAFYDIIFGVNGTISGYYKKGHLGYPIDEDIQIPEGYQAFNEYWYSELDQLWVIVGVLKHHLFILDAAEELMDTVCNILNVEREDVKELFELF